MSYDCESLTVFSGPRRLNGCIQSQEIGLKGDVIDGLDDFGDLLTLIVDHTHG